MNQLELIEDLIRQIDELEYRDEAKRDAIKRRVEMIARNIFGEDTKYLDDIQTIRFYPMVYPASEGGKRSSWKSGTSAMRNLLTTMKEEVLLFDKSAERAQKEIDEVEQGNKVFIVHGHDEAMKQSVARALEKLDLDPIILHERPSKGRTIIEKFTDYAEVSFALVLLSPDDIGYPRDANPESAKFRARQNVILELGYFLGKLGRERVLALHKQDEEFDMPSDYSGVLFVPFDKRGRWKFELVQELKACGYKVDANKVLR